MPDEVTPGLAFYFTQIEADGRHGRACPGHPRLGCRAKTWMRGTSPRMTVTLRLAPIDDARGLDAGFEFLGEGTEGEGDDFRRQLEDAPDCV
jgi:hypothetical protein